jgi:hypothetical protein
MWHKAIIPADARVTEAASTTFSSGAVSVTQSLFGGLRSCQPTTAAHPPRH